MSAARSASSPTVRRSFAQAAATVAKTASEARTARLIADAVQLYSDPGVAQVYLSWALQTGAGCELTTTCRRKQ